MPKYIYCCDECKNIFEIVHSMKEKLEICDKCKGSLSRVPPQIFINTQQKKVDIDCKVGDIVKNHIEESKKELKNEQDRMKVEEYK